MRAFFAAVTALTWPLYFANPALAVTYTNAINPSSWSARTSVFECTLEHHVPYYGKAVFTTRAGEASKFYLNAKSSRFQAGEAEVVAKAPVWKPNQQVEHLGSVPVKQGLRPMWLGTKNAEQMLSQLYQGKEIEFVRDTWYDNDAAPAMRLAMSTIGFREQYQRYLTCLTSLLPRNFEQMERTALYYSIGDAETDGLSASNINNLKNILQLVKHDSKIRRFYIDGHASAPGTREDNLELSKMRAQIVADFLKARGVPEDWMVVRWHGERYPAKSNNSSAGRAKNRRVTVRMERVEEIEVLPLAQK